MPQVAEAAMTNGVFLFKNMKVAMGMVEDTCIWKPLSSEATKTGCGNYIEDCDAYEFCPFCGKEIYRNVQSV